jgi:hypothetical protein
LGVNCNYAAFIQIIKIKMFPNTSIVIFDNSNNQ